jgi:hypothetical protein
MAASRHVSTLGLSAGGRGDLSVEFTKRLDRTEQDGTEQKPADAAKKLDTCLTITSPADGGKQKPGRRSRRPGYFERISQGCLLEQFED